MPEKQEPSAPPANSMIGLAYELIGFFAAPPLVGYFLDTRVFEFTGGRPGLFVFLGLFLGFAGGGWYLYRRLTRFSASTARVATKSAVIKEESVKDRTDRIAGELDQVARRIDGAVQSSQNMKNAAGSQPDQLRPEEKQEGQR